MMSHLTMQESAMKIPAFWAKESLPATGPHGKRYFFDTWGWSDMSADDARQKAEARVKELVAKVQRGETLNRYSYGERPLREEVLRAVPGEGGREAGIITRNAYGAQVLNVTDAMFVDMDFGLQ